MTITQSRVKDLLPLVVQVIADVPYYDVINTQGTVLIFCDATGGDLNINLPTAVDNTTVIVVKRIDSDVYTLTINPDGSETIDGGSTAVLNVQNESITLVSDNTNWKII